jgi:hypothetical protein
MSYLVTVLFRLVLVAGPSARRYRLPLRLWQQDRVVGLTPACAGAGPGGSVRWYRLHYHLSLGPVGGSDAAAHD